MANDNKRVTVAISELRAGMVLPADVSDAKNSNVLLLRCGIPVTEAFLVKLRERGVTQVLVDGESAAVIRGEPAPARQNRSRPETVVRPTAKADPELPRERLQKSAVAIPQEAAVAKVAEAKNSQQKCLQQLFNQAKRNLVASGQVARQIVAESVEHIVSDIDAFLKVALSTGESSEVYEHCLAAAQLSMSVGIVEGLDQQSLNDLGVGCVLSRIGQSVTATQTAETPRELTNIELCDLKRTPSRTYDCLQTMREVSVGARNVAYQIFERFDGSGYPRGRAGAQIHPLARIASVCDTYVALTSPRPYRPAHEPYHAVEVLIQETRAGKYDPTALRGLLRTVGLFPIGSFVRLTNGFIGQVIRNHNNAYDKPVVHIFFTDIGDCVKENETTIDLNETKEWAIDAPISFELINQMLFNATSISSSLSEGLGAALFGMPDDAGLFGEISNDPLAPVAADAESAHFATSKQRSFDFAGDHSAP